MFRFLCWFGWHSWLDRYTRGFNFFMPTMPRHHVSECCRCGKVVWWGHTLYGSVEYVFPTVEKAILSCEEEKIYEH